MRHLPSIPKALRKHLLRHKIATLPELKDALGTTADLTVFRKLKPSTTFLVILTAGAITPSVKPLASTTQACGPGLRFGFPARHSRLHHRGPRQSVPRGYFADELADTLHAEVQDPLHDLVRQGRLRRSAVAGRFLYTSPDSRRHETDPHQTNRAFGSFGGRRLRSPGFSG